MENKPSFLMRVGIARLIVFGIILLALVIGAYMVKPKQVQAPSEPSPLDTPSSFVKLTKEEVESQIEQRGYCEVDSDCEVFYGDCPFGCHVAVNKQFVQTAQELIENWREYDRRNWLPICEYGCMQLLGVQCRGQKCQARNYLPDIWRTESEYAALNEADLERFRETPADTREVLEERRTIVDQWMNGADENCLLTLDGKFVNCL